jgi:citronellol/citronellal dehydrogenase
MREAYNQWMAKHGGSIVNMTADMWGGMPGMGHSGAARSGVDNLTKTASVEWGNQAFGLMCCARMDYFFWYG